MIKSTINILLGITLSFQLFGYSSLVDFHPNAMPTKTTPSPEIAEIIPTAGVDFYTDRTMWANGCPVSTALVLEDFSSSLVPDDNVCLNMEIPWSTTANSCFGEGDLSSGYSLTTEDGQGLILFTQGGPFSLTSNAVGPSDPEDRDLSINFSTPVNSVSFDLLSPEEDADFRVEVFGASGLLDIEGVSVAAGSSAFVGAIAAENITRIVIEDIESSGYAQLISNLSFDLCTAAPTTAEPIPTIGEWGIICLGLLIITFGLVAVKKTSILTAQ